MPGFAAKSDPGMCCARLQQMMRSVRCVEAWQIGVLVRIVGFEELGDLRMAHRAAGIIDQQVLLRDVGDVLGFLVLGEQMVIGLIGSA